VKGLSEEVTKIPKFGQFAVAGRAGATRGTDQDDVGQERAQHRCSLALFLLADGCGHGSHKIENLGCAYKPNSITLASSELAPNMFEAGSCQIPLH